MISEKAAAQIQYCWKKISEGTFDQETIATLLMSIRDYVPKESFTRELGDFVAHPKKDRGIALAHVEITRMEMVNGVLELQIAYPMEGAKLIEELKACFFNFTASDGKAEVEDVLTAQGADILLCYLGILHFSTLHKKEKGSAEKLVGFLRANSMGNDQFLGCLILMAGKSEMPLFTTKISKYLKVACALKDLEEKTDVMALRGGDGLKLRRVSAASAGATPPS